MAFSLVSDTLAREQCMVKAKCDKHGKGSLYSLDVDACGCDISVSSSLCHSGRFFPDETFSSTGVMHILS